MCYSITTINNNIFVIGDLKAVTHGNGYNNKKECIYMKKEIYTTNDNGKEFTVQEVLNFLYNADNIGRCDECPYNDGYERGAAYIVGPCGQQNCWVSVHVNYEEDEDE